MKNMKNCHTLTMEVKPKALYQSKSLKTSILSNKLRVQFIMILRFPLLYKPSKYYTVH